MKSCENANNFRENAIKHKLPFVFVDFMSLKDFISEQCYFVLIEYRFFILNRRKKYCMMKQL